MFKAVIKTLALLAILFIILYVGMNNTHEIDFRFPIAGLTDKKPLHTTAALIYFGIFAIGVLAGTLLHFGGGSGGGGKKNSGAAKEK
ncbi:MAG: hypothetical protein HZA93_15815 [Verrucomicrobia bacterium]|nr:hypothetical protein [Verrucomicrobiota bacterium]